MEEVKIFKCKFTGKQVVVFRTGEIITSKGHITNLNADGYRTFGLKGGEKGNKVTKVYRAARIVAEMFIPNPENKPCVNHKNGVKTDDRVENLEWVTHLENTLHAYKTGLMKFSSKLKIEDIEIIIKEYKGIYSGRRLGKIYRVSPSHIASIAKRVRKTNL